MKELFILALIGILLLALRWCLKRHNEVAVAKPLPVVPRYTPPVVETFNPPPTKIKLTRRYTTDPKIIDAIMLVAMDVVVAADTSHKSWTSASTGTVMHEFWNDRVREGWTIHLARPAFDSELRHSWTAYSPSGIPHPIPNTLEHGCKLDDLVFKSREKEKELPPGPLRAE